MPPRGLAVEGGPARTVEGARQKPFQCPLILAVVFHNVLRRANDHETVAFFLVERTVRRTRPEVGFLGLRSITVPEGRVERSVFGRLRFRFDGSESDYEPENLVETRGVSEEEAAVWEDLQRMMDRTRPVLDPAGNLVSMRIGARILSRLPLGSVVAYVPDGSSPFTGSFKLSVPKALPELALLRRSETELLAAIDAFLKEAEASLDGEAPPMAPWNPGSSPFRAANRGILPLTHVHQSPRGRGQRCPLCHTAVIKDRFNPRIPVGSIRPGDGTIRDLKGGYMSRLRDTYLFEETESVLEPSEPT